MGSPNGNAFVSGAGGLRFKSWAGRIRHSVANGCPPLQHFFERSLGARRRSEAEMGPVTGYMPRRNTANIDLTLEP